MTPRPHDLEDAFSTLGWTSLAILISAAAIGALVWWVI
jgi:hypothetical protein